MRTAVVVGAGIGGVAAAVALQQVGWRVILLERASTIGEVGAGLSIWPSAVAELDRLGVRGLAQDAAPAIFGMRLADGRWVFQATSLGVKSPVMIHRAQLHDRITDQFGPNITIRTAFTVTGVDPDATGATVRGDGEELRADLVVAADGISSTVRGVLHPRHKGPVYAGYTSYRGLADVETGYVGGETWGRGRRFGFARLIDGRVYWYATGSQPAHRRDELSDVRATFGDWHSPIPDILAATAHLLQHDVYDLALPLPPFAAGHVALLGDAAHAMTPNLGRGACSAIEDAGALARHLDSASSVTAALAAYDAERRPATTRLVRTSRRVGQLGQVRGPVAGALRDAALAAVGMASARRPWRADPNTRVRADGTPSRKA